MVNSHAVIAVFGPARWAPVPWLIAADASGTLVMSVYYGTKPIKFEKGKAGIAVASKEKLAALIDTLIAAARGGELDDLASAMDI